MSKDIEELARFVFRDSNHRRPSKAEIKKHRSSPAVLEQAAALANTVVDLIQNAPPEDRFDLLKRMPTYDVLLALAYNSTIRVRRLAVQRERARRARKRTYRIGPDIWDSVKRLNPDLKKPEYFGPVWLPRTLDGFIEETLRGGANLQDKAPKVWGWLGEKLESLKLLEEIFDFNDDPRSYAYIVSVNGQEERLTYMRFEKILTRSRKPVKTLGELVGTLG